MALASTVIYALIVSASLGVVAWLLYRLLRWARASGRGANVLGAVLTEVTQSPAVQEAKQAKQRSEKDAGDPPNEK